MYKDAIISDDQKYRYLLTRRWDETKPMVVIIGLNPSTADAELNDPTIIRCINFAKSWDYGGFYMLNLFAFRATKPSDMFNSVDPVGVENDHYIQKYANSCDKAICAWGNHGRFNGRSEIVLGMLKNAFYLKLNTSGEPAHPLYLKSELVPQGYGG